MKAKQVCSNICQKFKVKKPAGASRYGSGQGRCQVCDIWIDHNGCHINDGSPASADDYGWFCNCCNYRVRRHPRNLKYKEKIMADNIRYNSANDVDLSYFNKYRALMIKELALDIIKCGTSGFEDKALLKSISSIELDRELDTDIKNVVNLVYAKHPPNKISLIVEFERIRAEIGRVPTKEDMVKHSEFDVTQYENEFQSWEHMLERLEYDPFYRDNKKNTLPTFEDVMLPLLEFLSDNNERDYSEVTDYLSSHFKLTPELLKIEKPSGGNYFYNKIGWAKTYLVRAGMLQKKKKIFQISALGLDILEEKPSRIDRMFLQQLAETILPESWSKEKLNQNQDINTVQKSAQEKSLDRINYFIAKAQSLIKSKAEGIYTKDLTALLDIPQEEVPDLVTRLVRIDGMSKQEIRHHDILLDTLLRYDDDVNSEVHTIDNVELLARQVINEHAANKKYINNFLRRRLTEEFVGSRSMAKVIRDNPEFSKTDIMKHVRTSLRLPEQLREMESQGELHSDPECSLQIALFAVNYYEWDNQRQDEEKVTQMAQAISKCIHADVKLREAFSNRTLFSNQSNHHTYKKDTNQISTAVAVWIATATLHKQYGINYSFSNKDIINKVLEQNLINVNNDTIAMHVSSHCVANSNAMPDTHRKLYRISRGSYRLYRKGDYYNRSRTNGQIEPDITELPEQYKNILRWYHDEFYSKQTIPEHDKPVKERADESKVYHKNSSGLIPEPGQVFTEQELRQRFAVASMGGIRPSRKNRIIVLIDSSLSDTGYRDTTENDPEFISYAGHGQSDQVMALRNKSLFNSKKYGYTLLYFSRPKLGRLVFHYRVEYDSHSIVRQPNNEGVLRNVILFKLKILDSF